MTKCCGWRSQREKSLVQGRRELAAPRLDVVSSVYAVGALRGGDGKQQLPMPALYALGAWLRGAEDVAQRLQAECKGLAEHLLTVTDLAQRLQADCADLAQHLHTECTALAHRLQVDCTSLVERLQTVATEFSNTNGYRRDARCVGEAQCGVLAAAGNACPARALPRGLSRAQSADPGRTQYVHKGAQSAGLGRTKRIVQSCQSIRQRLTQLEIGADIKSRSAEERNQQSDSFVAAQRQILALSAGAENDRSLDAILPSEAERCSDVAESVNMQDVRCRIKAKLEHSMRSGLLSAAVTVMSWDQATPTWKVLVKPPHDSASSCISSSPTTTMSPLKTASPGSMLSIGAMLSPPRAHSPRRLQEAKKCVVASWQDIQHKTKQLEEEQEDFHQRLGTLQQRRLADSCSSKAG